MKNENKYSFAVSKPTYPINLLGDPFLTDFILNRDVRYIVSLHVIRTITNVF